MTAAEDGGTTVASYPLGMDDVFSEVTDALNRAVDELGDPKDEFVAAAARRILEKTEW